MDHRQTPQLPFSRNAAASPYNHSRSPFPPAPSSASGPAPSPTNKPNQSPYPPNAPHPPPPNAAYPDQRRASDSPYYSSSGPRSYQQDAGGSGGGPPPSHSSAPGSAGGGNHSRHPSASSLPPAPTNRNMPPPGSPSQQHQQHQQQQQQQQQQGGQMGHYGLPPPRAPPMSGGPPTSFNGGRELPALGPLSRAGSTGSSMSISAMLGGPPASGSGRDSQQPPPPPPHHSQYPPSTTSAATGPTFAPTVQASPRMQSAEYQAFRRPQTPSDHARPYDPRGPVSASPQGAYSTTPEMQRYGTPSAYHHRAPSQDNREPSRTSAGPPPRPSSQPKQYQNVPPRPSDGGRPPHPHGPPPEDAYGRREDGPRGSTEYNPERAGMQAYGYDERYRAERDRREEMEFREREQQRQRAYSGGDSGRGPPPPPGGNYRQQEPLRGQPHQQPPPPHGHQYGRQPDPRDARDARDQGPGAWQQRPGPHEQSRAPYDPAGFYPRHPPENHPPPSGGPPYHSQPQHAPPYPQGPPPHPQSPHDRYQSQPPQPSSSHPMPPHPGQPRPYESPDRARMNILHPSAQPPPPGHRRSMEEGAGGPPPPPAAAYNNQGQGPPMYESPRKEELHNKNTLNVQEINRKGRVSPLPQAVQGAQPQAPGPAGEPGIKSEFGRMFSGIGSGVTGLMSSPVASGAQLAYGGPVPKREDVDSHAAPDSGPDAPGKAPAKGRRRKLKDVDAKGDDESTGRSTPAGGKNKRPKTHQHHHHHHHNHHHHHHSHQPHHHHHPPSEQEQNPAPAPLGLTPFKNVKGSTPIHSPTSIGKDAGLPNGGRAPQLHPSKDARVRTPVASPTVAIPPKPKTIVSSKEVLQSVANRPRLHLGDVLYEPKLQPGRQMQKQHADQGYSSTPTPLPWKVIKDQENCTLTVKVARTHLAPKAREEITRRHALWGTDVYTDDSDVVAACIHGGWIRGQWASSVDANLLDLDKGLAVQDKEIPTMTAARRKKERERDEQARQEANAMTYLTEPPKTGPVQIQAERDLHVTVLILPRLERYASTTRFGIPSREWGGVVNGRTSIHDGISFMVKAIRWVDNGAGAQSRLRGKGRRDRMRKAMAEVKEVNWPAAVTIEPPQVVTLPGPKQSGSGSDADVGQDRQSNGHAADGVEEQTGGDGNKENRPEREKNGALEPSGDKDAGGAENENRHEDKMDVDGEDEKQTQE